MNVLATHEHFMRQTLKLALKGQYTARPNPMVGCVLVQFDINTSQPSVIGEGFHAYTGGPHAEVVALKQTQLAGLSTKGAVAYVNLAPCCHVGKTPPCVDALIKAQVSEVVYAIDDPNSVSLQNQAENLLKQAGIKVTKGVLSQQAQKLNQGFISRMERNRPYVRAKVALSLDGNMALKNYRSQWITGEAARAHSQHYRAMSGAIATGMGTIIHDDPRLTVRDENFTNLENFTQPVSVVIGASGAIATDRKIFDKPGTLVFEFEKALPDILKELAITHQINDVLLESGPGLLNRFISENLIDELVIYLAPKLLGKQAMNISQFGPIEQLTQSKDWVFDSIEQVGEDIALVARPK